MEKVASNIKKFRELKNFTQEYLAKELNISQSHYQRMEAGSVKIGGDIIDQIAEILEVNRELLYSFDDRAIFQSGQHNAISNGSGDIVYYPIDSKIEKLYEDKIALLEEKIRNQEAEINRLKEK